MGKVISMLVGAVVVTLGLILLVKWWLDLMFLVRGLLPIALIVAGLVALLAGFSELKDTISEKKK